jgi:hypothetical protein
MSSGEGQEHETDTPASYKARPTNGTLHGFGGPENLDVEFDPGELEDLGDGHVSAVNTQVYRWKETGELAFERRARIEYTIRDGRIVRYEAKLLQE